MINPERYRQIDELFHSALDVAPADRPAFVRSVCNGDESLRQEVEALLASAKEEWRLMDEPVPEIANLFFPVPPQELTVGERLGHYNILSLLGTGGMGQVYLAEDSRLGRKIALKLLPRDFTKNELRLRRFQHEARAASSLNHPNILTIHEIGLVDDRHFIATEFIDGETLRHRMNRSQPSLQESLRITAQAARALTAAHAAGIVHRDMKPENIMLRHDGYIKVLDFGLAKLTEQRPLPEAATNNEADTRSGMIMGTVRYMSPEQARGEEVDARCDIFSLGVVIYEMIAGRAPFEGETNSDLIAALLKVEPPPLAEHSPDAPDELQIIVSKALCKNRDQRYQKIEEMLADIEALNEQLDLNVKLRRSEQSGPTGETVSNGFQTGLQSPTGSLAATGARSVRTALRATRLLSAIKRHKTTSAIIAAAVVLVVAAGWWAGERYFNARRTVSPSQDRDSAPTATLEDGTGDPVSDGATERAVKAEANNSSFVAGVTPLPFQERDWVLITTFENRTGDPVFDGSVEYAVEHELGNSSFVNVIPHERVLDALQLMKKPPDTKIDVAVGKEICLRDGAIRALLEGRIQKLGPAYVLSVGLIDPATSRVAASTNEEASSQEQIAFAVRRLSNWVRGTLGEALASIRQSDQELAKVTTPSLRALQLYSQANALMKRGGDQKVAEQMLRQALVEDPVFASAHNLLAWTIFNQRGGNQRYAEEWRPSSERALELSERVSERERLFILGSCYSMKNETDKEISTYEALVQRYPDDFWATRNLVNLCVRTKRDQQAARYSVQFAKLNPNDCSAQFRAAFTLAAIDQLVDASVYVHRARPLMSAGATLLPYQAAWIEGASLFESFFRGHLRASLKETDRLAQTLESRSGRERDAYALSVFQGYLRFGKLRAAEESAEKMSPETNREFFLATVANVRNDKISLRKHMLALLEKTRSKDEGLVPYLTRAGLISQAQEIMRSWQGLEGVGKILNGEIACAQGRTEEAISLLQAGVNGLRPRAGGDILVAGRESLAIAYEQRGDAANLLRVLEEENKEDPYPGMPFGLKMKSRLAQLYRAMGRTEDGKKIEAALSKRLIYADSDLPILITLKQAKGR
jgi:serine/threonine protein kinase/tetratricopeptide (TPR) repeat protein